MCAVVNSNEKCAANLDQVTSLEPGLEGCLLARALQVYK